MGDDEAAWTADDDDMLDSYVLGNAILEHERVKLRPELRAVAHAMRERAARLGSAELLAFADVCEGKDPLDMTLLELAMFAMVAGLTLEVSFVGEGEG